MKNLFLTILLLLLTGSFSIGQDSTYLWPTNSGNFLSSTFGETRSAHFHAGLDIKTWGREGYEVYASKDGILSQLLITNKGYGKAIYLKHKDGSYTVYAHLQRFNEDFQEIADSVRLIDHTYTLEEFLEGDSIVVKQGDVIGFTGSTGIGPPHLHFEIRNKYNQPVNPLTSNLTVEDSIPPVFSSILIEPLSFETRIFNSVYPSVIKPYKIQNDTTFFDTVFVSGKVGLSPNVYDEANSVTNKYAVYKLLLTNDDDTLYYEKLDTFDFQQADYMFMSRVPEPKSTRRSFQRAFNSINQNPFVVNQQLPTQLETGTYSLIADDYYGNRSVAIVPISNSIKKETLNSSKHSSFEYWTNDWFSINDSTNIDLVNMKTEIIWDSVSEQRILDFKDDINRTVSRLNPFKQYTLTSPDYKLKTIIPKRTFFDAVSIVQDWDIKDDTISIQIGVSEIPIRKDIHLQLYLGDGSFEYNRLNLYQIEDDGDTSYVDSWSKGSTLFASISSLGNFIVLRDSTSPEIMKPKIISLGDGSMTYSIKTIDDLSGIDYKSAFFEINGLRGIPEYDYENDTFTFYHPSFQIKKENSIYFKVKDKAGNFSSKKFLLKN